MRRESLLNTDAIDALKKEFEGASDRAAAVISGAFLDELLGEVLRAFFVTDGENDKRIFRGMGILGTFGAKTDIAYRLGLISEKEYQILSTIRSIRNDFAHEFGDISFSNQSIVARCKNIEIPIEMLLPANLPKFDLSEEKKEEASDPEIKKADSSDPRACFQESVVTLLWGLMGRLAEAIKSRRDKPIDFSEAHQPAEHILKVYKSEIDNPLAFIGDNMTLEEKSKYELVFKVLEIPARVIERVIEHIIAAHKSRITGS